MKNFIVTLFFVLIIASGCTEDDPSEPIPANIQKPVRNVNEELKVYANKLVANKDNGVSNPQIRQTGEKIYTIEFEITDSKLIADHTADQDTNPSGYEHNVAITKIWESRFCSSELKSIIKELDLLFVLGTLKDSSSSFCGIA